MVIKKSLAGIRGVVKSRLSEVAHAKRAIRHDDPGWFRTVAEDRGQLAAMICGGQKHTLGGEL